MEPRTAQQPGAIPLGEISKLYAIQPMQWTQIRAEIEMLPFTTKSAADEAAALPDILLKDQNLTLTPVENVFSVQLLLVPTHTPLVWSRPNLFCQ